MTLERSSKLAGPDLGPRFKPKMEKNSRPIANFLSIKKCCAWKWSLWTLCALLDDGLLRTIGTESLEPIAPFDLVVVGLRLGTGLDDLLVVDLQSEVPARSANEIEDNEAEAHPGSDASREGAQPGRSALDRGADRQNSRGERRQRPHHPRQRIPGPEAALHPRK